MKHRKMKHRSSKVIILLAVFVTLAFISPVDVHETGVGTALAQKRSRVKRRAATRRSANVRAGVWGGEHISMEVDGGGAKFDYDCAHGIIEQPLRVDGNGRFDLRGTHVEERGGPVRMGDTRRGEPARYVGRIVGSRLTLNVTLVSSGQSVGTFRLDYGAEPQIFKCR